MKSLVSRILSSAALALALLSPVVPARAQEDALKSLPGYVDFGELGAVFGEPTVQIAIGEALLNLVGAITASEEPEVAALFSRLKGVRVNVFETAGLSEGAVGYVNDVSAKLASGGWEAVVTVNSPEEQVRIFMKMANGSVEGITVMAVEATEAAFINVIGNLDPAELGRVMKNFDVHLDGAPVAVE